MTNQSNPDRDHRRGPRLRGLAAGILAVVTALAAVPAHATDDDPASPVEAAPAPVTIALVGTNDFHGRLYYDTISFAGTVEQLRAQHGEDATLFLSAGDNIGGSFSTSALQQDRPAIDVLNALELDATAVGNHEFDQGVDDLTGRVDEAANFPLLAANVIDGSGQTVLPAYEIFEVKGLDVAVIGAVTEITPQLVPPEAVAGVTFTDPVAAVNDTVAELNALADAPDVIVAVYHAGAMAGTDQGHDLTSNLNIWGGPFASIVTETDADVDAIFTGHTHQSYAWEAPVPGSADRTRPIVQSGQWGRALGEITLTVDPSTSSVVAHTVRNVPITTVDLPTLGAQYPRVMQVWSIVQAAINHTYYDGAATPVAQIEGDVLRGSDPGRESTMGHLVADALWEGAGRAISGADLGLVQPDVLAADLPVGDGVVTTAEARAVSASIYTSVAVVPLTGASLKRVFEQQWQPDSASHPYVQLGTSSNVAVTVDPARPVGDRVISLWVDGQPVDPSATYRVAVPNSLAAGGSNFTAFTEAFAWDTGVAHDTAVIEYLSGHDPVVPDTAARVVQVEGAESAHIAGQPLTMTLSGLQVGASVADTATVTLVAADGARTPLGRFEVTGGSTTVQATLPLDVTGAATLEVAVAGTQARVPLQVDPAPEPDPAPQPETTPDPAPKPVPDPEPTPPSTSPSESIEPGPAVVLRDAVGTTFAEEITWLASSGVTTGYPDGTFRGSEPVLREQMAAFLYRFVNDGRNPGTYSGYFPFVDVPPTHVFRSHIAWLANSRVTQGYADGTFRGSAPVLREQMAAFLYRVAGSPIVRLPASSPFTDVPASHTFYKEIVWLAGAQITTGYSDRTFRGSQPVLREQMAAFLYRFDRIDSAA